jgi:CheY-like chemotaxis protein
MNTAPKTVLVVDDHPARRYVSGRHLSLAGFNVISVGTGREALDSAEAADAVLLDVHLPDIDGFEISRILRSHPSTANLAIVHLSAVFVKDGDTDRGREAGADAYLIDPIPAQVLVQVINSIIADRSGIEPSARASRPARTATAHPPAA